MPVVNAGATYCRRKCFRTVPGRKCGSFQDQKDDGGTRHLYGHAVGRSVRYLITAQVWSIGRLSLIDCTGVEYRAFISDRVLPQPSSGKTDCLHTFFLPEHCFSDIINLIYYERRTVKSD